MRNLLVYILIASLLFQNSVTKSAPANKTDTCIVISEITIGHNYLMALRTVNGFLHAWATENCIQGPDYITDRLRETKTPEDIRTFFSGVSNPHHMAYEVTGCGYIKPDYIRFNIWLYEYYSGVKYEPVKRPEPVYIDVMMVGEDMWLVDTWPYKCK